MYPEAARIYCWRIATAELDIRELGGSTVEGSVENYLGLNRLSDFKLIRGEEYIFTYNRILNCRHLNQVGGVRYRTDKALYYRSCRKV
jgi:hypothetical protein